jgi:hypothetical protein
MMVYSCCSSFLPKIGEVPNLKALADVMNAEYSGDEKCMIITVTHAFHVVSIMFNFIEVKFIAGINHG